LEKFRTFVLVPVTIDALGIKSVKYYE